MITPEDQPFVAPGGPGGVAAPNPGSVNALLQWPSYRRPIIAALMTRRRGSHGSSRGKEPLCSGSLSRTDSVPPSAHRQTDALFPSAGGGSDSDHLF